MAKQLNIDLNLRANTTQAKQALQQLNTSLNQIVNQRTIIINDAGLQKAQQAAMDLQRHLEAAVNVNTGKYNGLNCHGEEKVNRFYKEYKDGSIDKFYSDLKIDLPLASLAKEAFLVKNGGKIIKWNMQGLV